MCIDGEKSPHHNKKGKDVINGDDLRAMRLKAGISQETMSKKLECDRKTVINYELGVSDIPSKKLFRWFQCCQLDFSALLRQIKEVRNQTYNNKSKLIDFISLVLLISLVLGPKVTAEIYMAIIAITAFYGAIKKDPNVLHIALILLFVNLVNYIIFAFGIIDLSTAGKNRVLHGSLIYGVQLIISVTSVIILIFRVQLSRILSHSKKIELTYFDGLFHWIFIYLSMIYILAIIELFARHTFGLHSITIIHYNFTSLVYIGWAMSCALLLTMIISTEKKSNLQESDSH